jgi:hypothetical protein
MSCPSTSLSVLASARMESPCSSGSMDLDRESRDLYLATDELELP